MGHYLKTVQLEELAKNSDVVPSNKRPSQVIADAFKQHKGITFWGWSVLIGGPSSSPSCRGANVAEAPTAKCVSEQKGRSKEGSPKEEKGTVLSSLFLNSHFIILVS